MQRPTFIKDKLERFPINVKVFSKYSEENYDTLDNLAREKGYLAVESAVDEEVEPQGLIGMQNSKLHSGWIAIVNDYNVKALEQIEHLNKKIDICKAKGENIIIGFCQTGQFSIGYSIYVKNGKQAQKLPRFKIWFTTGNGFELFHETEAKTLQEAIIKARIEIRTKSPNIELTYRFGSKI